MVDNIPADYLAGLPEPQRAALDRVNAAGLAALAGYLSAAILREIGNGSGTRIDPGPAPRHIAIMPWDPAAEGNDPRILARRAEISFGAKLILYPAPDGDHAALGALLSGLADERFPAAADLPARTGARARAPAGGPAPGPAAIPVEWVPAPDPIGHFTGRAEELARLDRWAADPDVRLTGQRPVQQPHKEEQHRRRLEAPPGGPAGAARIRGLRRNAGPPCRVRSQPATS